MHTFIALQTEWRTRKVHIDPDAAFIPHTLVLFSEVDAYPPPSWPRSCLLGLMADFVCIDTAPQSCTAVRGQRCPAGGQPNDKVNESGLDSDMPPSAITGARRKGGKEPMNGRRAENKKEKGERVCTGRKRRGFLIYFTKPFQISGSTGKKKGWWQGEKRKMEEKGTGEDGERKII